MRQTLRFALLCACVVLLGTDAVRAQVPGRAVGLGGQIGDPSGITLKLYQRPGFAYDFLAAWDFDDFFFLNAHALYERPFLDAPRVGRRVPRYFLGPGAVLGIEERTDKIVIGLSGNFGINLFIERFELFVQITPRINVIPNTDGDIGGGIGLRYYF